MGWIVDNRKGRAMGSRGNKTLIEQAADAIEAAVETAVDKAGPVMADAKEKAAPVLAEARDKAAPVIADAKDKAAPVLADARDKAGPMLADAKEKAMPILAQGAAIAAERAATAADYAASAAADARDAANAKAAELQKAAEPKKHRLRTFLLLAGIAAALGFLAKRLTSRSSDDDWQSSYTPPSGTGATAGTPFEASTAAAGRTDEGGASPDEALADAVAQGHAATTPDDPAEVVDVETEEEQSGHKP